MRLSEYLCRECTVADMTATTKDEALSELSAATEFSGLDPAAAYTVLLERENLGTTAVGNGFAIPHGKISGIGKMVLIFARSVKGIDFNAPDNRPCHFFFTVFAPEGAAGQHLGLLGSIARLAKDPTFSTRLLQTKNLPELQNFLMTL